jgi:hypothetical protein
VAQVPGIDVVDRHDSTTFWAWDQGGKIDGFHFVQSDDFKEPPEAIGQRIAAQLQWR